jgi:hypothetical protein
MQKNGSRAMLWVYQNPWHFSASRPMLSMTVQFQDFKSAIAARLAPHLIPSVQQAATAETLIQNFEKRFI